ncbi:bifunctional metallophosphatase/5'-nucleotidase [Alteromonas gracilis]|uniref:bifunctional metallophosphatase/5'-nucleotidase n=1 Tax=Alteromonas gracilis TaxID=1479524 RepID=UPI0037350824
MRFTVKLILFIGTLLAFKVGDALSDEQVSSAQESVTFVLTADMPNISDARSGRYANLQTLVKQQRRSSDTVFFIFGGGSIGPSALASFDRGSHIIDILNSLEPDVMGVTKREFSFYEDELSLRSYEAAFPLVASNALDKRFGRSPDGLHTSVIIEKDQLTLGVISVLHERVIEEYQLSDISITPPQKAIMEESKLLRQQGVDIILLHYSYPFRFINSMLNKRVIDVAFITDSRIEEESLFESTRHPNNMVLTQQGTAIIASFKKDIAWKAVSYVEQPLDEITTDAQIDQQLIEYEARLKRLLNIQIGEWKVDVSTRRNKVRSEESPFVNFVTDAIKRYANTDIALINGGSIRGDKSYTSESPITRQDVIIELPFRSHVVSLEMTGAQIIQALEEGLSQYQSLKGGFPHVSGMSYTFDSTAKAFQRVKKVTINGRSIDRTKLYSLATSNFLANGGDGYYALKNSQRRNAQSTRPPQISDLVMQAIVEQYDIKPTVNNRIRDVSRDGK